MKKEMSETFSFYYFHFYVHYIRIVAFDGTFNGRHEKGRSFSIIFVKNADVMDRTR